jgi:precorrin-6Y C5,15-methyltransferase (decarboxylating)
MSSASPVAAHTAAPRRWLSIVGIGEDGVEGLAPVARGLIADAEVVFGGKRHLALAGSLIRGTMWPWPSPFDAAVSKVVERRGRPVCVLASGDPFLYGVGSTLARHVDPNEMLVLPGPSSFSLAAARLGWSLPETTLLSLHGRPLDLIRPHLHPGARILALTPDGDGTAGGGCAAERKWIWRIQAHNPGSARRPARAHPHVRAADFSFTDVDALNIVALELEAAAGARVIARTSGLADALFEHDGQITKREIRAMTLSSLAPRRHELLWDVGAGTGSIAIEWLLADPSMRALAIESANGSRGAHSPQCRGVRRARA